MKLACLWSILTLFVLACAASEQEEIAWSYHGPVNSCRSNEDCTKGFCHPELNICAKDAPDEGSSSLFIKVIPNPSTGSPAQTFRNIRFDADGQITPGSLVVERQVTAQGYLKKIGVDQNDNDSDSDNDNKTRIPGRVIFTDIGNQLPGHSPSILVSQYDGFADNFLIDLVPSEYRIFIKPNGSKLVSKQYPVFYLKDIQLTGQGILQQHHALTNTWQALEHIEIPKFTYNVKGIIKWGKSPANGLTVVAVDPDERIISTSGSDGNKTTCDNTGVESCGYFAIRLPEKTGAFSIKITQQGEARHPVFIMSGYHTSQAIDSEIDLTRDRAIDLGEMEIPIRYEAVVYVKPDEPHDKRVPVPNSLLLFSSKKQIKNDEGADIGVSSVNLWVSTNEAGAIEAREGGLGVDLYPGEYNVAIIPPSSMATVPSEDLRPYYSEQPISITSPDNNPIGGQSFQLSKRPVLKGFVTAGDRGVPEAVIVGHPVEQDGSKTEQGSLSRTNTATSDSSGEFSMGLDGATYNVIVEAPKESKYAWLIKKVSVSIDTATEPEKITINNGDENSTVYFELPIPVVAKGQLTTRINAPINFSGTVIEWYMEQPNQVPSRAYKIAQTVTDASGNFTSLLPGIKPDPTITADLKPQSVEVRREPQN